MSLHLPSYTDTKCSCVHFFGVFRNNLCIVTKIIDIISSMYSHE